MRAAERQASEWNQNVPVGSTVIVKRDSGEIFETKTRSEAWAIPSGMALVSVEGISGGYSLDRVKQSKKRRADVSDPR
jgi:hypothetical protein